MPNRTREFVEACASKAGSSASSEPRIAEALRKRRKRKRDATSQHTHADTILYESDADVWTSEATRIGSSLQSLTTFLTAIRRAYLDLSSSSSASTYHHRLSKGKGKAGKGNDRQELDLSKGLLEAWKDVNWLDDRERDEVDWQAKTVLKRAMERLRELEAAETNRHKGVVQQIGASATNSLTKLLGLPPLQLSGARAAEDALHAHRHQITLFLSRRLADASRVQKEQQETRVNRQLELQSMSTSLDVPEATVGKQIGKNNEKNGGIPEMYIPAPIVTGFGEDDDDPPIDSILSQEQIQQFESESSQLLQEANTQLASIEKAQASLLEISSLQSQLTVHLTQQAELTDKLWEDSVLVTGRVEEGNKQLREARERNRESRIWLLVFLLGASFSLLFLEYY